MPLSKLIELSYFDGGSKIRLTAYADTVILENGGDDSTITAIRFGGYPEMVRPCLTPSTAAAPWKRFGTT